MANNQLAPTLPPGVVDDSPAPEQKTPPQAVRTQVPPQTTRAQVLPPGVVDDQPHGTSPAQSQPPPAQEGVFTESGRRFSEGVTKIGRAFQPNSGVQNIWGIPGSGRITSAVSGVGDLIGTVTAPVGHVVSQVTEPIARLSGNLADEPLQRRRDALSKMSPRQRNLLDDPQELEHVTALLKMPYEERIRRAGKIVGTAAEIATPLPGVGGMLRAPANVARATRRVRGAETAADLLATNRPIALRGPLAQASREAQEAASGQAIRTGGYRMETVPSSPRPAGIQQTLSEAENILTGGGRGTQRTLEAAQDLQAGRGPLSLGQAGKRMAAQRGTYQPEVIAAPEKQVIRHTEQEIPGTPETKGPLAQPAESQMKAAGDAMEQGGHATKGSLYDPADAAPGWPRAQTWLQKTIKKYREGVPANLSLLKERPDSPVISIVRNHQANRTEKAIDLIERQPWMKSLLRGEPVEEFGPKLVEWEANGFKNAPPEIQQAMSYLKRQYEQEKASRLYLGDRDLKEVASYWPRIREKDLDAVNVRGPIRGGLVDDVRTTLGAFEKSREFPTMQIGLAKGEKYIDPRRALLIRANTGHNLIETAGMLQDMERAGVVSRGANAFGKDGVELFKMPTGGSWWARGPAEARAIRDELTSVQHSSLASLSHWLNTYVRNPSLFNPFVHELKNMAYKYFLSGGNPRKLVQYENEFRASQGKFPYQLPGAKQIAEKVGVSPETRRFVDQFLDVMPESRSGRSAREVFGHAEFALEHPTAAKVGSILRAPQEASHGYLFGTADPAIKYARWRQYLDKGMDPQTAANQVRIDLIDYGTRSQLIDFWKSVPGNFFATWRSGTVQSLIKQARYHPVRTALIIGGFDYLRELAYRNTGYWLHTPVDYVEQPISRVVADAYKKGPIQAGADIASIIATTALLGPGGNPRAIQNMLQSATNPADLKSLKKVFWGLAQIADVNDAIPDIMSAIDSGDTGKLAGYLQAFMAIAAFGVHKVKDDAKRPPSWTQLIPEEVAGMENQNR